VTLTVTLLFVYVSVEYIVEKGCLCNIYALKAVGGSGGQLYEHYYRTRQQGEDAYQATVRGQGH
jgi:hypothetical protein